jgi:hypothetical protein
MLFQSNATTKTSARSTCCTRASFFIVVILDHYHLSIKLTISSSTLRVSKHFYFILFYFLLKAQFISFSGKLKFNCSKFTFLFSNESALAFTTCSNKTVLGLRSRVFFEEHESGEVFIQST